MRRLRPLNRREFLGVIGHGTVALVAQLSVTRNVLAIALGGSSLAACATNGVPTASPTNTAAPPAPSPTLPSPTNTAAPTTTTVPPAATATLIPRPTEASMLTYLPIAAGVANAYVLVRGEEVAIVDTGLPGNGEKFAAALETVGLKWDAVRHVILTHYHRDHVGSMGEVMMAAAQATAYAGADDVPLIESPRPITAVSDQSEVFGLQIIASPGHTKGHICVYDPVGSALILGDALNNIGGQLSGPNPSFTQDMAQATASARKLAALTFERAYFGHGTPIENGASKAIAALFPP
jgi:glyoxylase-like metal-dependent hydrolase (beta-lactamase superfamily II)